MKSIQVNQFGISRPAELAGAQHIVQCCTTLPHLALDLCQAGNAVAGASIGEAAARRLKLKNTAIATSDRTNLRAINGFPPYYN